MEQELTRPVRAAQIKDAAQEHIIIATDAERAALALRFGLPGILQLRGEFWLRHERAGTIAATLRMRARVIQTCVITLDPFEAKISEDTELRFVPASSLPESEGIELDPETLEAPDEIPYAGECIDLGETLAEQLALALDPYPRKPGAKLPQAAADAPENPFAVLKFKK